MWTEPEQKTGGFPVSCAAYGKKLNCKAIVLIEMIHSEGQPCGESATSYRMSENPNWEV